MPCHSLHPLDVLTGQEALMHCLSRVDAEVPQPRTKSFIVVEELGKLGRGSRALLRILKVGLPTDAAARVVARSLGVPLSSIGYAGLKDADATVVQHFTVPMEAAHNIPPSGAWLGRRVYARTIALGVEDLKPGKLRGNRFTIHLVGDGVREILAEASSLTLYPTYYGYQRFGSWRPNTHIVGLRLAMSGPVGLTAEYSTTPYPLESPATLVERITRPPPPMEPELTIARRAAAGEPPPQWIARLALQAFQAYLFNRYLSRRILYSNPREPLSGEWSDGLRPWTLVPGWDAAEKLSGEARRIYEELLREEGLSLKALRSLKPLLPSSHARPLLTKVNLSYKCSSSNNCWVSFRLERGCYATSILRELVANPEKLYPPPKT